MCETICFEIKSPPNPIIYKGKVWRFTVEPYAYKIPSENITATAISSYRFNYPSKTIDESGLDPEYKDFHSSNDIDMWYTTGDDIEPVWIKYEFNQSYKLHQMLVWNFNSSYPQDCGFRDVKVEYSLDDVNWIELQDVSEFSQAPLSDYYEYNIIVDFNNVLAKYVRLTAYNNWSDSSTPNFGLSEVRFTYVPNQARKPYPATNSSDIPTDVILSWRPGREAVEHEIYYSTNEQEVISSNTPLYIITTDTSYKPLLLDLSCTYYWRVDEVNDNETNTTWYGDIWNFTTQDYLIVDDFEGYSNEEPGRICDIWTDGRNDPANGSIIGYTDNYQYLEADIVHSDSYSAPIFYDNSTSAYSEVTVNTNDLAIGTNWTKGSAETLVLWFHGDPGNSVTDQIYVKINGVKIIYDGNPNNISMPIWKNWNIDLASLGINPENVTDFAIGVERIGEVGNSGVIFIDDIRLYRIAPPAPSEEIWIEAELPYSLSLPMMAYEDPDASGGYYISVQPGYNSTGEPPAPYGVATYSITVTQGTYKVSGRVIAPSADDDSFWVHISGATTNTLNHNSGWVRWNQIQPGTDWHWDDVRSNDDDNQMVEFSLEEGTHTMRIAYREDGAMLDAILITKID